MPSLIASAGERMATSFPSRRMDPSSGPWKPERIFMRVLLPAPFSPRMPSMEADLTVSEMPAFAWTGPNVLWMLRNSICIAAPINRDYDQ